MIANLHVDDGGATKITINEHIHGTQSRLLPIPSSLVYSLQQNIYRCKVTTNMRLLRLQTLETPFLP